MLRLWIVISLTEIASLLGRPVEQLQELDRRPLHLAFVSGSYEEFVIRDRGTGDTLEIVVSSDGRRVDPAELRARDRELAEERAQVLSDELLSLLLRHPDLRRVRVRVDLELSGREIIRLAEDAGVHRIELVREPEILDAPNGLGTAHKD